jgi:hypothetical protein
MVICICKLRAFNQTADVGTSGVINIASSNKGSKRNSLATVTSNEAHRVGKQNKYITPELIGAA